MKRLSERNRLLLLQGIRMAGSYEPSQVLPFIEEQFLVKETKTIEDFLLWVYVNGKTFGRANIDAVFKEFLNRNK